MIQRLCMMKLDSHNEGRKTSVTNFNENFNLNNVKIIKSYTKIFHFTILDMRGSKIENT